MPARKGLWFEWIMAACLAALTVWNMWHLSERGYLPQPFFYESSDTWMDWFNTAWWAHDRGIYDSWASIYPPISFVVLRALGLPSCYAQSTAGLEVRDCDWLGVAAIHGLYLLDIVLAALAFARLDKRTALPRSFALTAGMPLLYGLERGNLILLAFACMILAFGPLVRSARLRWLCLAIAINLKVYLVVALVAQLLRRRWRWFEGGAITFAAVYLASFAMLGLGTPGEIVRNITAFSGGFNAAGVLDVWYPATFIPMTSLLESTNFPITALVGSQLVETGGPIIAVILRAGQASILLAAAAIWFRPGVVPAHRATLLAVALALITSEAGGYTPSLILLFVMMERWEGWLRPAAIAIAYVLSLPGEIVLSTIPSMLQDSFFAGHVVTVQHGIGLGMFLRPVLNILAASLIAWHTIALVWRDWYASAPAQP
jgi:hypothetical protein